MSLFTIIQEEKYTEDLNELIEKALRQSLSPTPPLDVDDWFRVSSVGGVCPREEVLCARFGVTRNSMVTADLGMVFEFGHSIHWVMQNRIMPATGKLVGKWRCTWCGEIYGSLHDMVARPDECVRCGAIAGDAPRRSNRPVKAVRANAFFYMEQFVGDHVLKIGGHPDGFMIDGDPANFTKKDMVLLEFKTASENTFAHYKKVADFMHVIQCQVYMWLTGTERAKIIYLNKGKFGMAAVAQHDVSYDDESVILVKNAIKEIRKGLDGGPIPNREACATSECDRARACNVSAQCFEGDL